MPRVVTLPPVRALLADGAKAGGWWRETEQPGTIVCELCPRACKLKPGDRGFCFVRENRGGEMALATYGRSTGFCVDPIEKKPLNHFFPGTSVLSFGTAGCNLGCKFCQNWDISKSRQVERLSESASPEAIARAAQKLGCRSVAFTYNDPVIWAEYAIDAAEACRAVGVKTVAVTAAYITPSARGPFFHAMDAANVDLKAFSEQFYRQLTASHLAPVLESLEWLKRETDVWVEITNLVIPRANDSPDEILRMCDWLLNHLGDETPVHFSAFHPDYRLTDRPPTPQETLQAAYETAQRQGLKYVYVGNVNDWRRQSTYCPHCGGLLIERNWYDLGRYHLTENRCDHCGGEIAGRFDKSHGDWGRKRLPIRISDFSAAGPGDSPTGEGRKAMGQSPNDKSEGAAKRPQLTEQQEMTIHRAACEILAAEASGIQPRLSDPTLAKAADLEVMGAFVTAKRRGQLRGCCGMLGKRMPLSEALHHAATRTATQDIRLPAISPTELKWLDIDVSLLYGFQPIKARGRARIAEVSIGRHGLQIQRGDASGLLLPSVATEHGLDAERFLQQVCHKAGLPTTAWEDDQTRLLTFESCVISGPFEMEALGAARDSTSPPFAADEVAALANHCRNNVIALVLGATPNYYLPNCSDATVHGAALSVRRGEGEEASHFSKLSLRPGVPLQATLFNLAETAAAALRAASVGEAGLSSLRVGVSILFDPAMHGVAADVDLRGVDPQTRAVLVTESTRSAWVFAPQRTPDDLVEIASERAQVTLPSTASVYSLGVLSTESSLVVANAPGPRVGPTVRAPAVAGTFYPADVEELSAFVDQLLEGEIEPPEQWSAVMIPHAGLRYSGRIAAATLQRVQIPDTVIILCPKHTRLGLDWAVAPHESWAVPGGKIASNPELARQLAEEIPELLLDAAAHQNEHAIEVQLPLLARLSPSARVVGIVVGPGNLDRCQRFAAGLASVVRRLDPPPLLAISSDMNHYASDAENRRLDELALASLERLDPDHLYKTVNEHHISMCGLLPAVIVLKTLRQLGSLNQCRRVAYATSAEASGDRSRVVGYAGMLFR